MKRFHVNLSVTGLDQSVRFYSALFATPPAVLKSDYAKWMLEDPRLNFAITTRGTRKGVDHLGIQVENAAELGEVYARLRSAPAPMVEQGATTCCYAQSDKSWIVDPEGIAWEAFLTHGDSSEYGSDLRTESAPSACCDRPAGAVAASTPVTSAAAPARSASSRGCCA